jgi:phage tail protein X
MNNSRRYAEDLVGALKTEHYGTQRDVADKIYNTNWQNLENQYKNLKDKLEAKRVEENRAFASGLANTAESGYDMARANAQNLANRGLSVSGVQDLADKANTTVKGEQVLKLLDKLNNSTEANIEKLSDATSTMAKEEAKLNANLADTLGDIGAAQTNAQMSYNAGLADIAGAKDARDMENELAKMQREAQAAANARSRSGNDGVNAEIEDFYKKQGIISILNGIDPITGEEIDWDNNQKANAIQILFGVSNAKDVVDVFTHNNTLDTANKSRTENYNSRVSKYEKQIEKIMKPTTFTGVNGKKGDDIFYNRDAEKISDALLDKDYDGIVDVILGGDDKFDLSRSYQTKLKGKISDKDWDKLINAANEYKKLKNEGLRLKSYKDLDMLFYE